MTCTCAVYGWGRVDSPTCPIHNRPRSGRRPLLRLVREPAAAPPRPRSDAPPNVLESEEIEAHEQLLLAMLREHRESCRLCHDREDFWVTCQLGEVLRSAWFNAFRLLITPTRWSTTETVRPFQIGGVS